VSVRETLAPREWTALDCTPMTVGANCRYKATPMPSRYRGRGRDVMNMNRVAAARAAARASSKRVRESPHRPVRHNRQTSASVRGACSGGTHEIVTLSVTS